MEKAVQKIHRCLAVFMMALALVLSLVPQEAYALPTTTYSNITQSVDLTHDVSIVTFEKDTKIKLYFDSDILDLNGREIYPVKVGNHDEVMLPLEVVFKKANINYTWDKETQLLHIDDSRLVNKLTLKQGYSNYFSLNDEAVEQEDNSMPPLLTLKKDGLYILSSVLNQLIGQETLPELPDFEYDYNFLVPLIYHDLNKVVLISKETFNDQIYQQKYSSMIAQFTRADSPLQVPLKVMVNKDISSFEYKELKYEEGSVFIVRTKSEDYIMLPLQETCSPLGVNLTIKDDKYILKTPSETYQIQANVPLFNEDINNIVSKHEIMPLKIEDVLYISHVDLMRILFQMDFYYEMNYHLNSLSIIKQ